MGLTNSIKGKVVDVVLKRLSDGDKGSTSLGLVAGGLIAANVDFGKVFDFFNHPDNSADMIEFAKAVAVVISVVWGYFIGRKKPPKDDGQPPASAALAN